MTLLKQVLSDLFKEIGWIVLYGFLAAMTVMTCILVGLSYKHVSGQNSAITRFIANDVSLLQIKSCDLNVPSSSMDEPTSALDPISTSRIEDLAMELKKEYTIVMVTHNMQQATRISDKTAFFLLGEMVEYTDTDQLFSMPQNKKTEDYITGRFG